jgi:hypothetical protein
LAAALLAGHRAKAQIVKAAILKLLATRPGKVGKPAFAGHDSRAFGGKIGIRQQGTETRRSQLGPVAQLCFGQLGIAALVASQGKHSAACMSALLAGFGEREPGILCADLGAGGATGL